MINAMGRKNTQQIKEGKKKEREEKKAKSTT